MVTHYHKNDLPHCLLSLDFLSYDRRVTTCHTCTYGSAYRHCAHDIWHCLQTLCTRHMALLTDTVHTTYGTAYRQCAHDIWHCLQTLCTRHMALLTDTVHTIYGTVFRHCAHDIWHCLQTLCTRHMTLLTETVHTTYGTACSHCAHDIWHCLQTLCTLHMALLADTVHTTYGTAYRHCAHVRSVLQRNTHIHYNALPHITSRIFLSAWQSVLTLSIKKGVDTFLSNAHGFPKGHCWLRGPKLILLVTAMCKWSPLGWSDTDRRKLKYREKTLSRYHFVRQISHAQAWDRTRSSMVIGW
jgi:hypothetical protein